MASHRPVPSRIEIVPYRAEWPAAFERLAGSLASALGERAVRIDHIGSTSVPGLAAKDVIDVQVSLDHLDREFIADTVGPLGLRLRPAVVGDHVPAGAPSDPGNWAKIFLIEAPGDRRANIHVRRAGAPNARYALLFRDYLRAMPGAAAAYAELKRRLAAIDPPLDPDEYSDLKDPACDIVLAAAEGWAATTGWCLARLP